MAGFAGLFQPLSGAFTCIIETLRLFCGFSLFYIRFSPAYQ